MGIKCELPPLRSLDDFLSGSARFQVPNFQDLDKWGNRVAKNLLYYQTNYFLMGILVSTLFIMYNPLQTILGLLAIALVIVTVIIINPNGIQGQATQQQFAGLTGWLYIAGVCGTTFFVLYLFESVLYVGLITLLPFCLSFVHASFRTRNLRNKLTNAIDEHLRYTPMGVFLEAMSITVETMVK